jgi:hypothetical protein
MKAKDLLKDSSKWTQGALARNRDGRVCMPGSPDAESWCLIGAICRTYRDNESLNAAIEAVDRVITGGCHDGIDEIEEWNDYPGRTFEEILEVLEKADV